MCSWQQEAAGLASGLFSHPLLGSSSGHPSAAMAADDLMDNRVEGLSAAAVALQAAGRVGVQGAGDAVKTSHADLHGIKQAYSEQACRTSSSLPETDARPTVAQAGLNNSHGQPCAEVAKGSRKRAADSSCAEPATKRLLRGESSNMQLTGATAAVSYIHSHGRGVAAAAVPASGGGGSARAAQHGSGTGAADLTEGEAGGRRRVVKRKGRALQSVKVEIDLGDGGVQAMDMC